MAKLLISRIHDLSVPISEGLVRWPEDHGPRLQRMLDIDKGDPMTVTRLELGAHTGTHVDAPAHFLATGKDVAELDLDALVGPALVIDAGDATVVSMEVLECAHIPAGTERLLIRTSSSQYWSDPQAEFHQDYVFLTPEAAQGLVDRGVRLVGIDYLSVDAPSEDVPVHTILMQAGVIVVESLDLRAVSAGEYFMACLPLKILGAEAAPARVILLEGDEGVLNG